ncbi:phage tail tape measure protein [Anoxybacter fermentans]|uniref:Phage tail tape measure protein n=1 Tax=Anoxybacter fermentans TaxID=1323375 RepID=A0A3Q9HQU2_9FIRM|nr:phage tail tape measure protein [Anoxybacter fermentans]AZR72535.1 phage tail tape measure protein [Anoxybacter fermentans]
MNDAAVLEMIIRARQQLHGIDATIQMIKKMKKQFRELARTVTTYAKQIKEAVEKVKESFIRLNNAMHMLRNTALKAFTAIVAFTGIPSKMYMDFQQGMSNVNTLLNVSREELDRYSQGVIEVSNKIGESAKELTGALYDIISAGVEASHSIEVLELSGKAAKAGMTQTKVAVNAGIAAINAYNLEISELSRVYDLQFSTVKKGVITFAQLASAQGQLIPSARKVNATLEEMYGSLAYLTKQGLSAEEASTSLARAFDALVEQKSSFAQLGINVFDEMTGQFRGLETIVTELADKLQGLTEEEQANLLENLGLDIRAQRAIIPMIKNIEQYKETVADVANSAGAMEEAYKRAIDNIAFHWNRAKQNVINAVMNIGMTFEDEIRDMLDQITAWARAIAGFVKDNKEVIKSVIESAIKLAGTVALFTMVAAAIMTLMTPIGMVTAGIGILAAAWYLNIGGIREKTENAVNFITQKWNELKLWWQDTTWTEKAKDIGKLVLNFGGFIWSESIDLLKKFDAWIGKQLDMDDNGRIDLGDLILLVKIIWESVNDIWNAFSDWMKDQGLVGGDLWEAIKNIWNSNIGNVLKIGFLVKWSAIKIPSLISYLITHVEGLSLLGSGVGLALSLGQIALVGAIIWSILPEDWKEEIRKNVINPVVEFVKKGWSELANFELDPHQLFVDFVEKVKEWVNNTLTLENFKKWGKLIGEAILEGIKSMINPANWFSNNYTKPAVMQSSYWSNYANPENWNIQSNADGGLIIGPGTGTSDSILSWVSNGEYIVNARATRKWLPLLEAINEDRLPKFASGGYINLSTGAGTGGGASFAEANIAILEILGLTGNTAAESTLRYLAQISHDTENFQVIAQIIAGLYKTVEDYRKELENIREETEKLINEYNNGDNGGNNGPPEAESNYWKEFVNVMSNILESTLDDFASIFEDTTRTFIIGITNTIHSLNAHEEGVWGAVSEITNLFKGGNFEEKLAGLSLETTSAMVSFFETIRDTIISYAEQNAEKQYEEFKEAVDQFQEVVEQLTDAIRQGGSLQKARELYQNTKLEAEQVAREYAQYQEAQRQAQGAKQGAGWGALLGGIAGFLIGGPIGATIGAAIGGAAGAGVGYLANEGINYEEELQKLTEELEKAKETLAKTIEESFGLGLQEVLSGLNHSIITAINNGEDLAIAVGTALYGHIKESLMQVFTWATNELIAQQLEPILTKVRDTIMNAIIQGSDINFDTLIDIEQLIQVGRQAEKQAQMMEELINKYKEALREAGIDEEIIDQLFPMTEAEQKAEELAQTVSGALRNALAEALEAGNIRDFSSAMGEAIYTHVKDALIQAFMQSEVYQEMFKKWFDVSDITFTGNLAEDFETIQDILDDLEQQLKAAGLGFNYTTIPMIGNGVTLDQGLYGTESYFAPSTLEAGRDMANTFATAIEQFTIATDSLVRSIDELTDSINYSKSKIQPFIWYRRPEPDLDYSNKQIHNHYHFEPKINNMFDGDKSTLFEEFVAWKRKLEMNQA